MRMRRLKEEKNTHTNKKHTYTIKMKSCLREKKRSFRLIPMKVFASSTLLAGPF
jgi:hypothetical protein